MDDAPWYVSLIMSWLPFLILIGSVLWVTRTIGIALRAKDGRTLADAVDGYAREQRRANDLFEDAIKSQQRRLDAMEPKS